MIPKEAKSRAMAAAMVALGLVLAGAAIAMLWVSTYTPK